MIWTARTLLALTVGLTVVALALHSIRPEPLPGVFNAPQYSAVPIFAYAAVGALILRRSPAHAVGWIFVLAGLASASEQFLSQYATYVGAAGPFPGAVWAAWAGSWVWFTQIGLLTIALPVLFPTGRPLSSRWRLVLPLGGVALASVMMSTALAQGPLPIAGDARVSIAAANPVGLIGEAAFAQVRPAVLALFVISVLFAIVSMGVRYRRSVATERQQMKWLVFTLAQFAGAFVVGAVLYNSGLQLPLVDVGVLISAALIPAGAGVAILRYRIYDIDVLINRTLVYAAVSALLAVTYFGTVVLIQAALRPFTAGSELAVAASTLLVVGLFQPLRRRIQGAVDRRFYRSRYDAARTLDAFGTRLRNEVDLDAVRADLLDAVRDTVRPAHASVWLRERAR